MLKALGIDNRGDLALLASILVLVAIAPLGAGKWPLALVLDRIGRLLGTQP